MKGELAQIISCWTEAAQKRAASEDARMIEGHPGRRAPIRSLSGPRLNRCRRFGRATQSGNESFNSAVPVDHECWSVVFG